MTVGAVKKITLKNIIKKVFILVLILCVVFVLYSNKYVTERFQQIRFMQNYNDDLLVVNNNDVAANERDYIDSLLKYLKKWKDNLQRNRSVLQTFGDLLDDTYSLIIKEHSLATINVTERPVPLSATLNCSNPLYSKFLTSRERSTEVQIIDLILFAYEFTVLEIRLYELYDVVDEFIILESNLTFKKVYKPLFFYQNVRKFQAFLDKITLITPFNITRFNKDGSVRQLINVNEEDILDEYKNSARLPNEMIQNNHKEFFKIDYVFEYRYRELLFSLYSKYIRKFDDSSDLIIHGDLDEIPASNIIQHFKYCKVRDHLYPFSTWSSFFIYRFRYLFKSDFPALNDVHSLTFPNIFRYKDKVRLKKIRFVSGTLLPRATGVHCNKFYGFVTVVYKSFGISDCTGFNQFHLDIINNGTVEVYDAMKILLFEGKFNKHYIHKITRVDNPENNDNLFIPWIAKVNKHGYSHYF